MKKIVVFGRKDALETKIVHKFLEERTITFTSIIENKKKILIKMKIQILLE